MNKIYRMVVLILVFSFVFSYHLESHDITYAIDDSYDIESIEHVNFQKMPKYNNMGYSKKTFWVRFKLVPEDYRQQHVMHVALSQLDYIDAYIPQNNGKYINSKSGELRKMNVRDYSFRKIVFRVPKEIDSTKYVYMKFSSSGALWISIEVIEFFKFLSKSSFIDFFHVLFYGGLFFMSLYYLILGIYTRKFIYISFVSLSVFFSAYLLWFDCYLYEIIQSIQNVFLLSVYGIIAPILAYCTYISLVFFTKLLLRLEKKSRINTLLNNMMLLYFMLLIVSVIVGNSALITTLYNLVSLVNGTTLIVISFFFVLKGYKPARLYFISMFVFISTSMIFAAAGSGSIPTNNFTIFFTMKIGFLFKMVFLSLALVDVINLLKEENEKIKKEEALTVQQEKMSILGDITASVAHEINTPLLALTLGNNKLKKYVDKMRDETKLPETLETDERFMRSHNKYEKNMGSITNGLNTIRQQIINMKAFIKFQDTTTDFDLNDEIETTFSIMNFTLLSYMDVEKELAENLPRISGNASQINQLFMNMMKNASEAKKEGNEKGFLKFKTYEKGDNVILEISDKGVGINADDMNKIYDDRFSTKTGHRGMGLSISKDLMEQLNGEIAVQSKVGEGTTFTIILPAMKTETKEG